jgi:hypothetical protein
MNQSNNTRKILVVDDDPVIRDMMADILDLRVTPSRLRAMATKHYNYCAAIKIFLFF